MVKDNSFKIESSVGVVSDSNINLINNSDNLFESKSRGIIDCFLNETLVLSDSSDIARDFYVQSRFGSLIDGGKVQFSLLEALYLFEKEKIIIKDFDGVPISMNDFLNHAKGVDKHFFVRYQVFKDMRSRGYIVKTAFKFGGDFRVYDRGVKPGEDHAKWVIYPVHESSAMTWYEFAAKNRVAHSTKKRLMLGVVDNEGDVTYWEVKWVRP